METEEPAYSIPPSLRLRSCRACSLGGVLEKPLWWDTICRLLCFHCQFTVVAVDRRESYLAMESFFLKPFAEDFVCLGNHDEGSAIDFLGCATYHVSLGFGAGAQEHFSVVSGVASAAF